jgi:glycosyltransferase involved in cell wall biosynthesis
MTQTITAEADAMPNSRPRILVTCGAFPFPADNGDKARWLAQLDAIGDFKKSSGAHFELVCFGNEDVSDDAIKSLSARLGFPVEYRRVRPLFGLGRVGVGFRSLLAIPLGVPGWVQERTDRRVRRALLRREVDAIWVMGEAAGRYLWRSRRTQSVLWDRFNILGGSVADRWANRPARRFVAAGAARRFDRRNLKRARWVTVTSQLEGERLRALYGRSADAVFPSSVEPIDIERIALPKVPRRVGWLGTFNYSANVAGLVRFLEVAAPRLAELDMELEVVGSGTPPKTLVDACESMPAVTLRGYVEDLAPWIASLGAAVVPLWSGAGVKLKTLTFLCAGVPVVGTATAFEGVEPINALTAVAEEPLDLCIELARILALPADTWSSLTAELASAARNRYDAKEICARSALAFASWLECDGPQRTPDRTTDGSHQ